MQELGETQRRLVAKKAADGLDARRKTADETPRRDDGGGKVGHRDEARPFQVVEIGHLPTADFDSPRQLRDVIGSVVVVREGHGRHDRADENIVVLEERRPPLSQTLVVFQMT